MTQPKFLILVIALHASLFANLALATLNVQVLNASIPVSGTGTIDVEITGTGDMIAFSFLELRITANPGANSALQFASTQTDNFRSDGNYLFAGDSFNAGPPARDPRTVSTTTLQQDTFADNDSTNTLTDVAVTSTKLLARVNIEHIVPLGTNLTDILDDTFFVSVIGTSGDFVETEFADSAFNPVTFTSFGGTVSMTATAVPEPCSMTMLSMGMLGLLWNRRKRRRR